MWTAWSSWKGSLTKVLGKYQAALLTPQLGNKRIARSPLEPPATNAEAQAAELELEDCPHSEIVEVWPTMRRRWISRW